MIEIMKIDNMLPNKELTPSDVANILDIAYSKARKLMESNEIRSWIETRASDGRTFLKTIQREVFAYHDRKLESRAREFEKFSKPSKRVINQSKTGLSDKTIEEFFRTEILTG